MSAAPQNEDKADEGHYDGIPGARKEGALTIYKQFEAELDERAASFASMLPSTLSPARFKNTVVAAVRQDPAILQATIRSVMGAVVRAAQDGLVPDGREGHIAVYNVNVAKRGERERWEKRAQWNAMAFGLRKRLRELDGIIANAEVVHEADHFVWHQGDEPRIEHEPARLGTDRGKMIGAYCIYKREDGTILHREVMDFTQIEKTREQSKAKDSLMWTKFVSEGYRKSVLRRGVKTVPVSDQMREIIQRDDEANFDFDQRHETVTLTPPPAPPPAPKPLTHAPGQTLQDAPPKAPETVPADTGQKPAQRRRKAGEPRTQETVPEATPEPEAPEIEPQAEAGPELPAGWSAYLDQMVEELKGAKDAHAQHEVHSTVEDAIQGDVERGKIDGAQEEALKAEWEKRAGQVN